MSEDLDALHGLSVPVEPAILGGEGVLVSEPLLLGAIDSRARSVLDIVYRVAPPAFVFVLVLVAWQFVVPAIGLQSYQLPTPTRIWQSFEGLHSIILSDGWFTFWNEAFRGYLLGSALGFLVAVCAWRFRSLSLGIMPYAALSSSVPIVALAPALVVICGSDWQSKVVICAIMTVFPMTVSAYRGLESASPAAKELLDTYACSQWTAFRKLHLPASLPFVFNALKINATLAMIGAIVAEYFGSPTQGLGLFIDNSAGLSDFPAVWSGVVVACVIGICFYFAVVVIERRLTSWHVSMRGAR